MKKKLWIAYGVLGVTSLVVGAASGSFPLALALACVAAAAGWVAFFLPNR
jgi:hypothetical protein